MDREINPAVRAVQGHLQYDGFSALAKAQAVSIRVSPVMGTTAVRIGCGAGARWRPVDRLPVSCLYQGTSDIHAIKNARRRGMCRCAPSRRNSRRVGAGRGAVEPGTWGMCGGVGKDVSARCTAWGQGLDAQPRFQGSPRHQVGPSCM